MKRAVIAGAASLMAALTAGCAEPPVKPIPEAVRRSVTAASADVSGSKNSDTSKLGARGTDEGGRLGALQGAAMGANSGSLLGMLVLMPVGAAVGGAKGAAEARPAEIVDETRSNLRLALQDTDFTELLRRRLATSKAAGATDFSTVTSGSASAPLATSAGTPVGHVIALEYRLQLYSEYLVNPLIGVYVQVTAQVQSPDRRQLLHSATWSYCSERTEFVQAAANNAALFRAQINQAATILGEAIPHDLYVSRQPRTLKAKQLNAPASVYIACMDFSDLPSRTGEQPFIPASPTAIPLAPAAQSQSTPTPVVVPTPVAAVAPTPVAAVAPAPGGVDGTWQMDIQVSSTFCLSQSTSVTFANRTAEGPWGKLQVAPGGELSGWMKLKPLATGSIDYLVNVSGRLENGSMAGSLSGRCSGTFTMRKP